MLAQLGDVDLTFVPYNGIGPATPDLIAGRVDLAIGAMPSLLPQVQSQDFEGACGDLDRALGAGARHPERHLRGRCWPAYRGLGVLHGKGGDARAGDRAARQGDRQGFGLALEMRAAVRQAEASRSCIWARTSSAASSKSEASRFGGLLSDRPGRRCVAVTGGRRVPDRHHDPTRFLNIRRFVNGHPKTRAS